MVSAFNQTSCFPREWQTESDSFTHKKWRRSSCIPEHTWLSFSSLCFSTFNWLFVCSVEKASRADTDPPHFETSVTLRFERFTWHSETTGRRLLPKTRFPQENKQGCMVSTQSHKEPSLSPLLSCATEQTASFWIQYKWHSDVTLVSHSAHLEDSITSVTFPRTKTAWFSVFTEHK